MLRKGKYTKILRTMLAELLKVPNPADSEYVHEKVMGIAKQASTSE